MSSDVPAPISSSSVQAQVWHGESLPSPQPLGGGKPPGGAKSASLKKDAKRRLFAMRCTCDEVPDRKDARPSTLGQGISGILGQGETVSNAPGSASLTTLSRIAPW
eukprot:Skav218163  [mRNA]  locus=scaffold5213:44517:48109:+ [translate_table: standard]